MTSRLSKKNSKLTFSSDELLEISQEINRNYALQVEDQTPEVVALPVDPYHLYAYWSSSELSKASNHQVSEDALTLRVYWHPEVDTEIHSSKLWFDLDIDGDRNQCKVELPVDETFYSVAIGKRAKSHEFEILARSNIIHVPRGKMAPEKVNKPLPEPEFVPFKKMPESEIKTVSPESEALYDEVFIDSEIKNALHEKGIEKNVELMLNPDTKLLQEEPYNEMVINSKIKKTFYEKGIEKNIDRLLTPALDSIEEDLFISPTLSGQGK